MKLYYELDLHRFEAWSGAKDTLNTLTYDQIDTLEAMLPDILGEDASETSLNDLLWFETDAIADWLGFEDWEDLEHYNNGDQKIYSVYKCSNNHREPMCSFLDEDEANDFCYERDWEFVDGNEFVWELEIEEEWANA